MVQVKGNYIEITAKNISNIEVTVDCQKDKCFAFIVLMRLPEERVAKFDVTLTKWPQILMVSSFWLHKSFLMEMSIILL